MRIHQPGKNRGVTEIAGASITRNLILRENSLNLLTVDENGGRPNSIRGHHTFRRKSL
jgi:hypothetical protein